MQFDQLFVILRCNLKLFHRQAGSAESLEGDLRIGVQLEKTIGGSSNQIEIRILQAQQGQVCQAFCRRRTSFQKLAGHTRSRFDIDRKSTRLNSSHLGISYAVFCLKKKKKKKVRTHKHCEPADSRPSHTAYLPT